MYSVPSSAARCTFPHMIKSYGKDLIPFHQEQKARVYKYIRHEGALKMFNSKRCLVKRAQLMGKSSRDKMYGNDGAVKRYCSIESVIDKM